MKRLVMLVLTVCMLVPAAVRAELPWQFDGHTRYMALGDSLAAGYGAIPATEGYVYLLYRSEAFDKVPNTLFCNAGVPGATSADVLAYQVPQAITDFRPGVITLTVGGNDLMRLMVDPAAAPAVLGEFGSNLAQILGTLKTALPNAKIYVSNLYSIPEIPASETVVPIFNGIVAQVAAGIDGVAVADVYSAFKGRNGLLLVERHGADPSQVHPTNAGYRAMAKAFEDAIGK